ncbi:glycosyl transferase, group 1 family protein [Trichomonas vaginalis G3]|uniref:Alpha-1,3/1,6-mannosyltransferase ALG2 n=1 Tax=Trichomonas vaginalis (strain ATCC PRA-98 / G3) TaxID=412133 RepID=A2FJW8_TRIV3|nr:glycosyl transferase [Trichomonas vaginalis G3]EAX94794.1 glycosyl transferase, group 1 family protein [Trichomonas vaginalis G3]KAI5531097.1 GT4 ALG2-like domain-containing protein [Trichomonas vaginalis G3]|eukprot:XP_001307724.1 glycosyl transferase [Trichomonas vaginalis G3]
MTSKKIAVLHPDLGIGGAERLIIDVAHAVMIDHKDTTVYTTHYDTNHCFPDTKDLTIKVAAAWVPRSIFGFGHIIFSLFSFLWLTIYAALTSKAEIFIVDQISAWVPILRLLCPRAKIIFYCHFPDLRLASHKSLIRKIYRLPFDLIEKWGIKASHLIYVNSNFTAGVTKQEFGDIPVRVLYPCVDTSRQVERKQSPTPLFVSLNRYERKKDHNLAIKALAKAITKIPDAKLVIAGGYDDRVTENVEHYKELRELAEKLELTEKQVELQRSISDQQKWDLIASATAMIYTPQNEHFGIVPIEAENAGCPVIACNTGGPLETCNVEGCFICEPTVDAFADAMVEAASMKSHDKELRENAERFGFKAFAKQLHDDILKL